MSTSNLTTPTAPFSTVPKSPFVPGIPYSQRDTSARSITLGSHEQPHRKSRGTVNSPFAADIAAIRAQLATKEA